MDCECGKDLSDFMNWDTYCNLDFIECPDCKKKYILEWDEYYDEDGNIDGYFYLENYLEMKE